MSEHRPVGEAERFNAGDRVAIAAARWNGEVVERLLNGCAARLRELGAEPTIVHVPGAFELPTAAKWLAESGRYAAVICLGCVIRGETPHFDYVAGTCAHGVLRVALDAGVPVLFGVLTVETLEQALARSGGEHGHAGVAAAEAAAAMAAVRAQIGQ